MAGGLTLSRMDGTEAIALRYFTEDSFPRERIEGVTSVSFSAYGTAATDGRNHDVPYIWNFVVRLRPDGVEHLQRLEVDSRSQNLLLVDRIERVWDAGTIPLRRSALPLVDVGLNINEPNTLQFAGGKVGYYACFAVRITAPIKPTLEGNWRNVSVQLTEAGRVLP